MRVISRPSTRKLSAVRLLLLIGASYSNTRVATLRPSPNTLLIAVTDAMRSGFTALSWACARPRIPVRIHVRIILFIIISHIFTPLYQYGAKVLLFFAGEEFPAERSPPDFIRLPPDLCIDKRHNELFLYFCVCHKKNNYTIGQYEKEIACGPVCRDDTVYLPTGAGEAERPDPPNADRETGDRIRSTPMDSWINR